MSRKGLFPKNLIIRMTLFISNDVQILWIERRTKKIIKHIFSGHKERKNIKIDTTPSWQTK